LDPDIRGAVRPSTSQVSSLVESVNRHANGTKVHNPIENSVPSPGGCQDIEGTNQGPRKEKPAAEEIDVVITSTQHEDLPIPPKLDSSSSSVDANGSKLEYIIEVSNHNFQKKCF